MRKVFQEIHQKRLNRARGRRVLQKRRRERAEARQRASTPRPARQLVRARLHTGLRKKGSRKRRTVLVVPSFWSIRDNPEETLEFFETATSFVRRRRRLSLDLALVRKISPDAILYYLCLVNSYKARGWDYDIEGNVPVDASCRALLIESGFFNYVQSDLVPKSPRTRHVLQVKSGSLVDPRTAHEVVGFARGWLSQGKTSRSRAAVNAILEAMQNVRNHAYEPRSLFTQWFLMALHNQDSGSVNFTIVDNGQGIPTTMRRRLLERGRAIDHELILSALEGKTLRSRTRKPYRGRGLPQIYAHAQQGKVANLLFVSSKGFVTSKESRSLRYSLRGTLISWDFV